MWSITYYKIKVWIWEQTLEGRAEVTSMLHVVQGRENTLGCLSGPGRELMPRDSTCSVTISLSNRTLRIQLSLHQVTHMHWAEEQVLIAVCGVYPSDPWPSRERLQQAQDESIRVCLSTFPQEVWPFHLKPPCFTWTLNFFHPNPHLFLHSQSMSSSFYKFRNCHP